VLRNEGNVKSSSQRLPHVTALKRRVRVVAYGAVPGISETVDDSDVVRFTPTSLGPNNNLFAIDLP
jgi:hypothetical protein